MKLKHRVLTLLLTVAMLFTFMPAMAFAEEEDQSLDPPLELKITGVSFSPANIVLKPFCYAIGPDGSHINRLSDRKTYVAPNGEEHASEFIDGDKLTVRFGDGSTKVFTFKMKFAKNSGGYDYDGCFINGDQSIYAYAEDIILKEGNNKVTISLNVGEPWWYDDENATRTTINVFLDTTALKELNFDGIQDGTVPAVKGFKVKAGKKSFTVSWKKAKGKKYKKFQKVEIQYSKYRKFPFAKSKAKEVKKSKTSFKAKKLKKGVYYVRVRNIKYVHGEKITSKWCKWKKVKIK